MGNLYLEGLVHEEAYFRNFTVYFSSEGRSRPITGWKRGLLSSRLLYFGLPDHSSLGLIRSY